MVRDAARAVRAVYEAGPTGFGLARAARAAGVEVMVCAPGAIPRQPGDQIKTDTRDALKLARLLAAGQLRPVVVPAPELEALRDLVRAREDLRGDLMGARHRVGKLLLRRGLVWDGPGAAWSQRHLRWLGTIRFDDELVEVVFGEYLAHHEVLLTRRDRLDKLLLEQSTQGSWAPNRCTVALPARGRHADRGRARRRDRRHHRVQTSQAAGKLPRPRAVRTLVGDQAPPGRDHEGRQRARPPAARRGWSALRVSRLARRRVPGARQATAAAGETLIAVDMRGR